MSDKLKYRMKFKGNGWQIQSRVWWIFWMNVGYRYYNYDDACLALKMANNIPLNL